MILNIASVNSGLVGTDGFPMVKLYTFSAPISAARLPAYWANSLIMDVFLVIAAYFFEIIVRPLLYVNVRKSILLLLRKRKHVVLGSLP